MKVPSFHIYLPALAQVTAVSDTIEQSIPAGQGKILFMDDEADVRKLGTRILSHCGYCVESVADGNEAIRRFREAKDNGEPFELVILDLTVPGGMGGEEAIRRLRDIDPSIKAIVSSGYSTEAHMADFKRYGFDGVIPKPYQMHLMKKTVYDLLHGNQVKESW